MSHAHRDSFSSPANSHLLSFGTQSYDDPIPVTLEPWGVSLFPLPDYRYVVEAQDRDGPPDIEFPDGSKRTPGLAAYIDVVEPLVIWLGGKGRELIHRAGHGGDLSLIWDSQRPSAIADLLTDPEVARLILEIARHEDSGSHVWEHEFAQRITPYGRRTGRYDIVLLLREHGLIRKKGGEIITTQWGRQFADMYWHPQDRSAH